MNTTKKLFVVGTGTDVGKTYVTSLIIKKLHDAGINAAYCKVAMSGNTKTANGKIIPGDAYFVKKISGIQQSLSEMCKYLYEMPASPHLASRYEKNYVDMRIIEESFKKVCEKYDYITIEGSGGIVCPIRLDGEKIMLEDIIKNFDAPCVIVADSGLGTINNVVLTSGYMKQKKLRTSGIIFNNFSPGDIIHGDNVAVCEQMTGIPIIAKIKKDDKEIDIDIKKLVSLYE